MAAYTFSKSYSMSGWRIGFAVAAPAVVDAIGKLINTSASCSPPFAQRAAQAALEHDTATRDDYMERFRRKVDRLCDGLERRRRLPCRTPGRNILRLPRRASDLQPLTNHLARPGTLSAGRGRRPLRRGLPGRRMFRRGRPGVLAIQLRRARRAHRPGDGVSAPGDRPRRSGPAAIWRRIRSMCFARLIRRNEEAAMGVAAGSKHSGLVNRLASIGDGCNSSTRDQPPVECESPARITSSPDARGLRRRARRRRSGGLRATRSKWRGPWRR